MKILSLISSPSLGGAELLARNLTAEFVARGHDCSMAFVSDARSTGNSVEYAEKFKATLERMSVPYETLGHECRRNPIRGGQRLRRLVREFEPDIVHLHLAYGLLFRSLSLLDVPTIYTHHSIALPFPRQLFRWFDRSISHYVAICRPCAALLEKAVRRPITLIPNGVVADRYESPARSAMPANPVVLSVGSLTHWKDYGTLIDAAGLLVPVFEQRGRSIRFQIAGGGPDREVLAAAIAEKGLADHLELLGAREDVPELMKAADLVVNSSIAEGLPTALIEATIAALPIVATDVGGTGEVVRNGQNGLLVPPCRADLLAEAIDTTLSDPGRYVAFSRAAKGVGSGFTLQACASAHLELYARILDSA